MTHTISTGIRYRKYKAYLNDRSYVYSTNMSPGNQGVFKLLKEVTFRGIVGFYNSRNWGHFVVVRSPS